MKRAFFTAHIAKALPSKLDSLSKIIGIPEDEEAPPYVTHVYGLLKPRPAVGQAVVICHRPAFRTEAWTDSQGKEWPSTYHHEAWWVIWAGGNNVVMMSTAAAKMYLKTPRDPVSGLPIPAEDGPAMWDRFQRQVNR